MSDNKQKFKVKYFAGTDFRALDGRFFIIGVCCLPLFVGIAVLAILFGTEVIASDQPIPMMLLVLFMSCIPLACALFLLIWYGKAYKMAKYVFYNSVEVEAVPFDLLSNDYDSPPKGSVYGITYAILTRPEGLCGDSYRVRCAEDDEKLNVYNMVNKLNEVLVRDVSLYRYNGYGYTRYTASYPFKTESEASKLCDMRTFKVRINADKGIALYYKPEYAENLGEDNNHL